MEGITLAQAVAEIARRAGAAIMEIYRQESDFQVEKKDDDSPLTIADRTANQIINEGLKQLPVQYPIVSEENKTVPYAERKDYAYFWLVDPLDGTKEFIKRNGEFTVNIALVYEHRPILGVVYIPARDELFWAVERAGAFLVKNGELERLQAPAYRLSDAGLRVVASRSHLNAETQQFIDRLTDPVTISRGSSLKFLALARGEADLYPRLAPTMEWDTGAAQIILEEAGGMVLLPDSRQPLSYNKEELRNPSFIAYGKVRD